MHLVRAFKVLLMVVPVMKAAPAHLCCRKIFYQVSERRRKKENTRVVAGLM